MAAAIAALAVFGFVLFAVAATREASSPAEHADAIVVLTGGEQRLAEGARLLSKGYGRRLLISGVNERTSRHDLHRLSGLGEAEFNCCVDLGYVAKDTIGNASETRAWAMKQGFDSLIVVTSSYHMPRSLAELSIEMPDVRLIPHAVTPRSLRQTAWWLHFTTTRVLVSEYIKFLPAAARLTANRILRPFSANSVARATEASEGKI